MFYNYKVVGDVLYLYVDDKCEIGSFFGSGKDSLIDKVKDYVESMKIKFDGAKVVLLISGLMLGTVYLNRPAAKTTTSEVYGGNKYVYNVVDKTIPKLNEKAISDVISTVTNQGDEQITNVQETSDETVSNKASGASKNQINKVSNSNGGGMVNNQTQSSTGSVNKPANNQTVNQGNSGTISIPSINEMMITLKRSNGSVVKMSMNDYLVGVVGAEMPASFSQEALKAQAVVARTYTLKLIESGRTLTDTVSTQVYKSNDELRSMWGSSYNTYYNKIKNAVSATSNFCIKYNGRLIDAVYHSTSNGYTEDAVNVWGNNVPYLKSVTSPWDTSASSYLCDTVVSFNKISSMLGLDFNGGSLIEIISRDGSNRISRVRVNGNEYSGVELRNLLGLRSADFDVSITGDGVMFTTRGYGHGVGMSQYGANGMANSGYSYEQIIKHYYTGVQIVKM